MQGIQKDWPSNGEGTQVMVGAIPSHLKQIELKLGPPKDEWKGFPTTLLARMRFPWIIVNQKCLPLQY